MLFVLDNYAKICKKNCLVRGRVYETLAKAKSACSSNEKCIGIADAKIKDGQSTGRHKYAFRICYDGIYVRFHGCIYKKNNDPNGRYNAN